MVKRNLSAHKHCDRNCLYEETQAALGRQPKRDEPETLINQAEQYNKERYPQNIGLIENGILFIHDIMRNIHASCTMHGKEGKFVNYVKGANIAGFIKVADAMMDQGIV